MTSQGRGHLPQIFLATRDVSERVHFDTAYCRPSTARTFGLGYLLCRTSAGGLVPRNMQVGIGGSTYSYLQSRRTARSQRTERLQVAATKARRLKYAGIGQRLVHEPLFLTLEPDGSDVWRLEPVIQILKDGGVGIIPTDSLPAVVCDLSNRNAALKLYNIMELAPKKMLSILVTSLSDISRYTTGFPVPTQPGQPDLFRVAQRLLPGPYTFILPASKNLPRQVIDFKTGKTKQRNSVGVRMPKDPTVQAVIGGLGECLLSHSVHVDDQLDSETECPDTGTLLDMYGNRGLDFIVDTGRRVVTATSIVDLTGGEPEVIRVGQGDVSMFQE